jgi:hypothetical protein
MNSNNFELLSKSFSIFKKSQIIAQTEMLEEVILDNNKKSYKLRIHFIQNDETTKKLANVSTYILDSDDKNYLSSLQKDILNCDECIVCRDTNQIIPLLLQL